MTTQRRTLELTPEQWERVEFELRVAARRWAIQSTNAYISPLESKHRLDRHRDLLLAAAQIKAAGAADHDGGPVGTARYTVR